MGDYFYAYIINTEIWKPIAVDENDNVVLRQENGNEYQVWNFVKQSDGSYIIINGKNNFALDVNNGCTDNGTNILTYELNYNDNQHWFIYGESGAYYLKAKCTDCVMDVTYGNSDDGTNIQTWEFVANSNQKFQIWKLYTDLFVSVGNKTSKTSFHWDNNSGPSSYDLKIWNGTYWVGDTYHTEWRLHENDFSINLPIGHYEAYIDANYGTKYIMSNVVKFDVEENYQFITGDINLDNNINIADSVLLQKYLLGSEKLTKEQFEVADINQDEKIDVFDMVFMRKMLIS